ncbi:class I SAM-dependent methyltransferase [Anabaenopsis arnoldii]|uniref:Class I SAM-dependent methyltransferase n=1 Tax=Anabaenopsis arnoldii TaxID=2152938 RepID=A0ABT5AV05_9CYAN|nr:class I SAM-dependent methyltransferase [Anabaenopsis arnoldii]MDB9541124.1 class I SAM-dependent methyltransferase [Anabaenopsis arnoldii]MDH6093563.1 class I SAM-dependent methyltransferase [Anabaenopsis arnoldii]
MLTKSKKLLCRACGSDRLVYLWDCADFPKGLLEQVGLSDLSPGQLYRCQDCGLGQRLPCLTADELKQVYATAPGGAMDYELAKNAGWSRSKTLLLEYFQNQESISVLDVGCNEGKFLHNLPTHWHKFGVEGGIQPAKSAGAKGVNVIAQRLQDIDSKWHHCFDVVTMFDVFEHLINPLEGIDQAEYLLKPGGVLLISTGDMDAWTWRWFKGNHWYLQTPLHLSFATRQFFDYVEKKLPLKVKGVYEIPHQLGSSREVWDDRVKAAYYECWQRGGFWRLPQRAIFSIPQYSHLKHLTSVPWTMKLVDHFLVICLKPIF